MQKNSEKKKEPGLFSKSILIITFLIVLADITFILFYKSYPMLERSAWASITFNIMFFITLGIVLMERSENKLCSRDIDQGCRIYMIAFVIAALMVLLSLSGTIVYIVDYF